MNLIDLSIKRPVLMTMVIMTFVVLGLFSLTRLGIDITPDVDFPFVMVTTVYPGAGPEEIETQVSEPIEEVVGSIGGVKHVTSLSQEGLSLIFAEFELGMNVDLVAIDVKDKVGTIRQNLPADIQEPVIQKFDIRALPIIDLALSSPRPLEETYRIADEVVKRRLSTIRGVANIELTGGREREIQVRLSRRKLRAYDLTPQQVIGQIAAENLNIPSGHIIAGRSEYSVRMAGEFRSLDELRGLEISLGEDRTVRLEDLGWVEDGFKEQRERATFNGESSVGIGLVKRADANTVATAEAVFREVERLKKELPSDVRIEVARDRSRFIKESVDDVFGNMIVGAALTAAVLFLFLHSLPATVIAGIAMPVSIVSTFILIDFAGFTLNMMSLMGLAISVGILVTNSIVVLENIERYRGMGLGRGEAASRGTKEIAIAVMASTLTNVVVFTPMAFMSGIVGRFFQQFGLTVAFATLFSLLVSFTLTPMMASVVIRRVVYVVLGVGSGAVIWWRLGFDPFIAFLLMGAVVALARSSGWLSVGFRRWDAWFDLMAQGYRAGLAWALRHKAAVVGGATGLFLGSLALLGFGFIGSEFFPSSDQGSFSVSLEMPVGTSLEVTDRTVNEVARRIMNMPYVKSVYAASGVSEAGGFSFNQGVHLGVVVAMMVPREERPVKTSQFIEELYPKLADIPGAKITVRELGLFGGGREADLQVEITGTDIDRLNFIADGVMARMREAGGLVNISSSWSIGKPEVQLVPKRQVLADRGLSPAAVGMTLRNLIEGEVASKFRDRGEEYDIRVELDPAELQRPEDVGDVYIKAGEHHVRLSELVELRNTLGPTTISRKDKQRMVVVSADVSSGTLGQKVSALRKYTSAMALPPGYRINYGGEAEMMGEAFGELLKALALATILTYMLLAAILESYKHPFTIMLTLPLGTVGVMLSLFLTNKAISIFSLMAMVMLVGIVVNNAILLIDYITVLRVQGRRMEEAIVEACAVRLRPIVMTNLATMLGMLPLALGFGAGGEFRSPMAIVTIGGLISSTVFTLFVIPVVYRILEGAEGFGGEKVR